MTAREHRTNEDVAQSRAGFGNKELEKRASVPLEPAHATLLTVQQVADRLGVSTRTVRRLIRRGELGAHRIGRSIRVDGHSVTRLLEATQLVAPHGTNPCPSDATTSGRRTSCGAGERTSTGRRGSAVEKSVSTLPIAPKPPGDSMPLPRNARELREAIRRLAQPS
jgi:excisionase family DNA binding protein